MNRCINHRNTRVDIESIVDLWRIVHKASLCFEWNTILLFSLNWSNSLETDVLRVIGCVFQTNHGRWHSFQEWHEIYLTSYARASRDHSVDGLGQWVKVLNSNAFSPWPSPFPYLSVLTHSSTNEATANNMQSQPPFAYFEAIRHIRHFWLI